MTSFYKLSGDRTQAHVFTDSTVCSYDGQLQCNGWICIVTCHFPKIRYVLPQPPSMCWANWRDDSRWCLFNLFQTLRPLSDLSHSECAITLHFYQLSVTFIGAATCCINTIHITVQTSLWNQFSGFITIAHQLILSAPVDRLTLVPSIAC